MKKQIVLNKLLLLAISAPKTIDARACEHGGLNKKAPKRQEFFVKYNRFKTRKLQNASFRPVKHDKQQETCTTTQTKAVDGYIFKIIAEKQPFVELHKSTATCSRCTRINKTILWHVGKVSKKKCEENAVMGTLHF